MKPLTRKNLYDLVWSQPMSSLAKKFDLSDRGLAKICAKHNIPVPARGYWAKLEAGQKVFQPPLPARSLGASDKVQLGRWGRYEEDDLETPLPPPPSFDIDLAGVRAKATSMVSCLKFAKTLTKPHSLIHRLLEADEERIQQMNELNKGRPNSILGYVYIPNPPLFNNLFEKRRLKILNALFLAFEACDMLPNINNKTARNVSITVGDQVILVELDGLKAQKQIQREKMGYSFAPRDSQDGLILTLKAWPLANLPIWQDTEDKKLEDSLPEIATAIIVAGEEAMRQHMINNHKHQITMREERLRRIEEAKQAAEAKRIADQAQAEQQRIDHLLSLARCYDQASEIRRFVESVRTSPQLVSRSGLEDWTRWALEQADQLDPLKSGEFLDAELGK